MLKFISLLGCLLTSVNCVKVSLARPVLRHLVKCEKNTFVKANLHSIRIVI